MEKILVVIDMQNDFVSGSLGTEEAKLIVPKVVEKVKEARANGHLVLFTRDTHHANYLSTDEGKKLPVEHCIFRTHGWEIVDELGVFDTTAYNKNTFGSDSLVVDLERYCEINGVKEIEFCGLCTGICVLANVVSTKTLLYNKHKLSDVRLVVDASCCACVTKETHKIALEAMKLQQIDIINE